MPLQVLPLGVPFTILNGIVYALPGKRCLLFCSAGAPALAMSNDPAFATTIAVVLTNGQMEVAGGFIKATADTPIIVKPR